MTLATRLAGIPRCFARIRGVETETSGCLLHSLPCTCVEQKAERTLSAAKMGFFFLFSHYFGFGFKLRHFSLCVCRAGESLLRAEQQSSTRGQGAGLFSKGTCDGWMDVYRLYALYRTVACAT